MKPTVVFTGGHHNSSLVIAKELKKEGYRVAWIGHKFNSRHDKSFSAEYQEVTATNIPFYPLKTGKFYRHFNPIEYLKIVFGFFQSFSFLLKIRPALIVSFGGYLSVPVVITGWLLGIPSITHEQTVVAGWANKAISPFVKKILLTHQSSVKKFPLKKTIHVGLPLEEELLDIQKLKKKFSPPLLFITCGKQGSHIINQSVFPIIPKLVEHFTIVHQIGSNSLSKDADKARRIKDSLGFYKNRYQAAPYYFGREYATYLTSANLVISRSGAHTTYKIAYLQKHSILIPIPWVSHNEQMGNATLAKKFAPITILPEADLSPETLLQAINETQKLTVPKTKDSLPIDAKEKILKHIKEYL
jgi:UDP-N-acetylglucosamine--N-acetylmuramyl-(pentapeptide) pyrophosphoryl-undecaprenol N-acetylglucosamine transferase